MRNSGFTLMELVVVIAIISLVALLVVPRLPSSEGTRLQNSARSLAAGIRLVNDRSVTTKSLYRLRLNLADNSAVFARIAADGSDSPPDDPLLARQLLGEGIQIEDVITERLGKVSEGEVVVRFSSGGLAEFVIIHLKGGRDEQYTIMAYPHNGKVVPMAGYQEARE
jgi:general secretion pathway protein H